MRCSFTGASNNSLGRSTEPKSLPSLPNFFAVAIALPDLPNEDRGLGRAGHGAAQPDQVLLRIHPDHREVLHRDARAARPAWEGLPREGAGGVGARAERAGLLVGHAAVR